MAPGVGGDLLGLWEKWDLMAGVDMGVALGLHTAWVATEVVMAVLAWAMVLRMASTTMVLALMVSPKDMVNLLPMASSPLPMDSSLPSMANSLLHLLIRPRYLVFL